MNEQTVMFFLFFYAFFAASCRAPLLQPWLDESQSEEKIFYHITATTKQ